MNSSKLVDEDITDSKEGFRLGVLISLLLSLIIGVWLGYSKWLDIIGIEQKDRGSYGDQFGALNTLFTGLAFALLTCATLMQIRELSIQRKELRLQRNEMLLTRKAFEQSTDLQQANLSGSILIPIFESTRSIGKEIGITANMWRWSAKVVIGDETPSSLVMKLKSDPENAQTIATMLEIEAKLVEFFEMHGKTGESKDAPVGNNPYGITFTQWSDARRSLSLVAQKVYQIQEARLVLSSDVARVAAFPDFVATYKFCVYPLDLSIEQTRRPSAKSYPPGATFISNYADEELVDAFY